MRAFSSYRDFVLVMRVISLFIEWVHLGLNFLYYVASSGAKVSQQFKTSSQLHHVQIRRFKINELIDAQRFDEGNRAH